jgi:hypothetical protein
VDIPGGEKIVKAIGATVAQNLFVKLRKIANHPLLIRRIYTSEKVAKVVKKAVSK